LVVSPRCARCKLVQTRALTHPLLPPPSASPPFPYKQILPLLAPSFSLPYPTRRDVHLDYAPSLRAMQEADLVQNAGGRVSRRTRTYFSKVVEFEDVDGFREGLACLARTALASEN